MAVHLPGERVSRHDPLSVVGESRITVSHFFSARVHIAFWEAHNLGIGTPPRIRASRERQLSLPAIIDFTLIPAYSPWANRRSGRQAGDSRTDLLGSMAAI